MKVKQLRFKRWGTLHGTTDLDPAKVNILLVDTAGECGHLEEALNTLFTGASAEPRADGGAFEAVLEGQAHAGDRFRIRGEARPPWVVPPAELARGLDLDALCTWLRARVDAPDGSRTAEDVTAALERAGGTPAREGLAYLDAALLAAERELTALEQEQAIAAAHLDRSARLAAEHARLAPVVTASRDRELRRRLGELERNIFTHRSAHRRYRELRRALAALPAGSSSPREIDALARDFEVWLRDERPHAQDAETLADLVAACTRVGTALARRAWADRLSARTVENVGRLAGRLEGVEAQVSEVAATIARAESGVAGARPRRIAHLAARVGSVSSAERATVHASLSGTTDGRARARRLSGELAYTRGRLDRIHTLQSRLRWTAGALGVAGALAAIAVQLMGMDRIHGVHVTTIGITGILLAMASAGVCAEAGPIVSSKREELEAAVRRLSVPLELEELRLSVAGFQADQVCARHGFDDAQSLADALDEYDRLTARRDMRSYMQARAELARLQADELAPLEAEARALIDAHGLPAFHATAAAALRRAWTELQAHSIGAQWNRTLTRVTAAAQATHEVAGARQAERLESLRARLATAGVAADPVSDPAATRAALDAQRVAAVRRAELERHRPALRARLLAPAALRALLRERRALLRPLGGVDLKLSHRQLSRLAGEVTAAAREAQRGLQDVYRRRPVLHAEQAYLRTERARLQARIDAAATAQRALDAAVVLGRGPAARVLNGALPRWAAVSPGAHGARFGDDLTLHLPLACELTPHEDPLLAQLAIRAGIAASAGVPLVLVEPFEGFDPVARARLVRYLTAQIAPFEQVIVISRLRSRWELLRWEAPGVFPHLHVVNV